AYPDSLVLPIEFIPAKTGAPVSVTLKADIGVCEEICVPASFSLTADLPTPGQPDPVIRAALASGPTDGHSLGLARPRCTVEPIRDGLRLHADIALPDAAKGDFAVIETADPGIWISPVEVQAGNGHLVQTSDMVPPAAKPFMLDRSSLRMTLFTARGDVIELTGCSG
ncbi:MAG: hypothetical protein ORN49_08445, partial [Rhodobacteraceae bacterium]|nr:hypothetical protein [Paracoccaceae bacterium]